VHEEPPQEFDNTKVPNVRDPFPDSSALTVETVLGLLNLYPTMGNAARMGAHIINDTVD